MLQMVHREHVRARSYTRECFGLLNVNRLHCSTHVCLATFYYRSGLMIKMGLGVFM